MSSALLNQTRRFNLVHNIVLSVGGGDLIQFAILKLNSQNLHFPKRYVNWSTPGLPNLCIIWAVRREKLAPFHRLIPEFYLSEHSLWISLRTTLAHIKSLPATLPVHTPPFLWHIKVRGGAVPVYLCNREKRFQRLIQCRLSNCHQRGVCPWVDGASKCSISSSVECSQMYTSFLPFIDA